jgi:hypothetical protein
VSRVVVLCRTITAARLDRVADLDRDLAAVAAALHRDAGVAAGIAAAVAREAFRPGETVRAWWNRATAGAYVYQE